MADDDTPDTSPKKLSGPETYTPEITRTEEVELEAPHGETEVIEFKLIAGRTYTVLSGSEADAVIGWGAVSQNAPAIRKSALPN